MNFLQCAWLGVVEGLTEFLPVSSTGHLILFSNLMGLRQTPFLKTFEIAIQMGAVAAVVARYANARYANRAVLLRVAAAFVPTAAIGLAVHPLVKGLMGSSWIVLVAMFAGGVFLIIFERFYRERPDAGGDIAAMSLGRAALIGVAQCAAFVPGVSRAAATVIGGLALGLKRETIVEFSFLLAVPTIAAATALDLLKHSASFSGAELAYLAVGSLVSFAVASLAIRFLLAFVRTHRFTVFGVYRILVTVIFWYLV